MFGSTPQGGEQAAQHTKVSKSALILISLLTSLWSAAEYLVIK